MSETRLYEYKFNSLNDTHPKDDNIPGLNIQLMNHQKTSLYHCQLLERNEGITVSWTEQTAWNVNILTKDVYPYRDIYASFGIIGCKVGSGKSFVALGLILKRPLLTFDRMESSENSDILYSFKQIKTEKFTVPVNIILVPHNLFSQWKNYIKTYTNLNSFFVSTTKELNDISKKFEIYSNCENIEEKNILLKFLTENVVYLVSSKTWNNFTTYWSEKINKKISRLFIDEVHSIYIPNCNVIKSNFIWFITSSIQDIYDHRNIGFIRNKINTYSSITKSYQDYIIIKNTDEYVDSSLQLPTPIIHTIICKMSKILHIFSGIINNDVKNMLNAEDIDGVVSYLGLTTVSETNIIQVLCSNLEKELDNAKMMYNTKSQMHYTNEQNKIEILSKAKEKIDLITYKINSVKERISDSNMDPIMHMDIINPVITSCCKNKFDLESITSYYEFQEKKNPNVNCPLCREKLDLSKLIYLCNDKLIKNIEKININGEYIFEEHTKLENLEYILKNNIEINKKILIFSEHEGNLCSISEIFTQANRNNLSPLKGSLSHIDSLINKFNNGEICNLFLNAKYCGSGLNLEKTDVIIIMHKMTQENTKQIIGRGNRIGRTTPLNVYFLYAVNE